MPKKRTAFTKRRYRSCGTGARLLGAQKTCGQDGRAPIYLGARPSQSQNTRGQERRAPTCSGARASTPTEIRCGQRCYLQAFTAPVLLHPKKTSNQFCSPVGRFFTAEARRRRVGRVCSPLRAVLGYAYPASRFESCFSALLRARLRGAGVLVDETRC